MIASILGFLLSLFGFVSYFLIFARWPLTRDLPWVNLPLVLLGAMLALAGLRRSFREGGWGARIVSAVGTGLSLLLAATLLYYVFVFTAAMPTGRSAPAEGARAPNFEAVDQVGRTVRLADLLGKKVLLVFFRGHW